MHKIILTVLLAMTVVSCSNFGYAFEIDGFKDIKFNMTREEVEQMGFSCNSAEDSNSTICTTFNYDTSEKFDPKYTLLGREAEINIIGLEDNKVVGIFVTINSLTGKEAVEVFKKSLGKPIYYERSIPGIYEYLWVSSNNNSISVNIDTENPDEKGCIFYYGNEAETLKMLSIAKEWAKQKVKDTATPDPKDF